MRMSKDTSRSPDLIRGRFCEFDSTNPTTILVQAKDSSLSSNNNSPIAVQVP